MVPRLPINQSMFFNGISAVFFGGVFVLVVGFAGAFGSRDGIRTRRSTRLGIEPGPLVKASRGAVWPKPQSQAIQKDFFIVRPSLFQFKVIGKSCKLIEDALERYRQDLKSHDRVRRLGRPVRQNEARRGRRLVNDDRFKGYMDEALVNLSGDCEDKPRPTMDEHCVNELTVDGSDFPGKSYIFSRSTWGILRGLETWSQLVYSSSDFRALLINGTSIEDFPRFSHRGLLLDTSRHFLPLRIIYSMLDAMAMSKMNVFHWHLVDDQSFPYESIKFPDLSVKGAYSTVHVYSQENVQEVIAYAAGRGIRVVPEFDTPGHTRSWGEAYPQLLTECYSGGRADGSLGPMNPIAENTYAFMKDFLEEIKDTFVDPYIHLGGDEVDFECWSSNPELREYMIKSGKSVKELEDIYVRKIVEIAKNMSSEVLVWQEVFDDGVDIDRGVVIHVWKGNHRHEVKEITSKGYKALLSSCWYLDALSSGGNWHEFYKCDPHDSLVDPRQKALVLGGEACMWGEVVDATNVLPRVWPRACAAAEKLWSSPSSLSLADASRRLEEHVCRMNRRRIPAQPANGPGFCPGINHV